MQKSEIQCENAHAMAQTTLGLIISMFRSYNVGRTSVVAFDGQNIYRLTCLTISVPTFTSTLLVTRDNKTSLSKNNNFYLIVIYIV